MDPQNTFGTDDEIVDELLWNTFDYGWLCDSKRPLEVEDPVLESRSEFDYGVWENLLSTNAGGLLMSEGASLLQYDTVSHDALNRASR